MLKLTKTGIGLLTKQYKSVLIKCLLLNLGLFLSFISTDTKAYLSESGRSYLNPDGNGNIYFGNNYCTGSECYYSGLYAGTVHYLPISYYGLENLTGSFISSDTGHINATIFNFDSILSLDSKLYEVENRLLNYYYTFRVDETEEVIEFTKELETSFSVILRSAEHDVRISARSAARIDTGLKSGDRHVASLLTMTNLGVNASKVIEFTEENDSLSLMEVCHA